MQYRRAVHCRGLVLLLLLSCGSHHVDPGPAVPSVGALPAGPPLATPGERMAYRLKVAGMDVATYDIAVGDVTPVGGHDAVVVQSHAKAKPLVAMLANIDEVYTSWIDVTTGRPVRWTSEERTADGTTREAADARFDQRSDAGVPIEMRVLDRPAVMASQKVSLPEVWDYNALVIALRAWEAKPGTTVETEVMRGAYLWHTRVTVRGKETVVTDLGDFPALRFDGTSYRLQRDGGRDASAQERAFSVWISNDDGRVPLKNIAESDHGQLEMTLVDYQPGNGNRLRP